MWQGKGRLCHIIELFLFYTFNFVVCQIFNSSASSRHQIYDNAAEHMSGVLQPFLCIYWPTELCARFSA